MPKAKISNINRIRSYVGSEYGEGVLSTDGSVLFCEICEIKVVSDEKRTVPQHVSRVKRIHGLQRNEKKKIA